MRLAMRSMLLVGVSTLLLGVGCKKDTQAQDPNYPQGQNTQQYPQQQYPQQQYPQQQYPQGTYTPATTAPPAATAAPPPGGLPCQTENDPQCTFGHCLGGKCGGCTTNEHCKAGAACMQTPLGGACMPGGAAPTQ